MWETKEVTLTLRLPHDIADQAEELHAAEPEFLERLVLLGITRRAIYRGMKERAQEPKITVDVTPGGVVRTRYDFNPPIDPTKEEEGRRVPAEGCGEEGFTPAERAQFDAEGEALLARVQPISEEEEERGIPTENSHPDGGAWERAGR